VVIWQPGRKIKYQEDLLCFAARQQSGVCAIFLRSVSNLEEEHNLKRHIYAVMRKNDPQVMVNEQLIRRSISSGAIDEDIAQIRRESDPKVLSTYKNLTGEDTDGMVYAIKVLTNVMGSGCLFYMESINQGLCKI
jgi:hypothetical protein